MENQLKTGDYVRIISHKFLELHPKGAINKSSSKTPDEMEKIQFESNNQGGSVVHFRKNALFEYKLAGLDYIGIEGVVIKIRNKAECEYEKITKDIARYMVKIKSHLLNWKNKIVTLYPSQVQRITKLTYKETVERKKGERNSKRSKKELSDLTTKTYTSHE